MPGCYYDCVNGQLVLLASNCPDQCPQNGGPCVGIDPGDTLPGDIDDEGPIVRKPCP